MNESDRGVAWSQVASATAEIGVGYNGSVESEHALELARKLAGEHGARLSAFEAVALPAYLFTGDSAPVDATIEEAINDARARVEALEGAESHAAYGPPSGELALYSARSTYWSSARGPTGRSGVSCTEAPPGSSRARPVARCSC